MLPFENVGGEPSENWKGSAFEEAISSHFESAGYDIVDLETRNRRLMELGFDPFEPVSRATAIGLGKDVAAQRLIVGSFRTIENRIDVEARLVDLKRIATIGIVDDFGKAGDVAKLSNQIAKNLFRLERDRAPSGFDERAQTRERLGVAALEASAKARISTEGAPRAASPARARPFTRADLSRSPASPRTLALESRRAKACYRRARRGGR